MVISKGNTSEVLCTAPPTHPPIFLQQHTLNPNLQKLSSLWEEDGIIFPVNGWRKLEKHLSPGLWNMFVLCEGEMSFVCL